MNRIVSALALAALFGGCATAPMKSTFFYEGSEGDSAGKLASRVNLWPLAYYREPALSVLWPIFTLDDDHFAIRPFYSQYRQGGKNSAFDEFNFLWPICQIDTQHGTRRVLPFYWSEQQCGLFPLFSWEYNRSAKLFPLVWWKKNRYFNIFPLWWSSPDVQVLLPIYYQDATSIALYPLYGKSTSAGGETEWYGPVGWHRGKDGDSDWCFPFYYRDETNFISLPWISSWDATGESAWFSPLLLSGGASGREGSKFFSPVWCAWQEGQTKNDIWALPLLLTGGENGERGWAHHYLLDLAGIEREKNGDYADWLLPFYYRDEGNFYSLPFCSIKNGSAYVIPPLLTMFNKNGNVATPLFGWDSSCNWVWPLYYWDKQTFASLLYCRRTLGDDSTTVIPPLLAKFERFGDGRAENCLLLGLAGWSSAPERGVYKSRLFPLYCHNADKGEFLSIPFGHTSDLTFVTPLLGVTHRSHASGGWLWPLFGWVGDDRMADAEELLHKETLDPRISIDRREYKGPKGTNGCSTATDYIESEYTVRGVEGAWEKSWQLSGLSTSEHRIFWSATDEGRTVVADETEESGNSFAYKSTAHRRVTFDVATRKRTSVDETCEAGLFFGWLWHYKNNNGNVLIDAFPAFTCDSRTNGYAKTSFLWRFFRNEYDPAKGREVDFLFLPIWR